MAALEKYVELFRAKGIKVTHQRLEIAKYLDKNRKHPTADKIYRELKKKNPSLSKTTVYNSLDKLASEGMITVLNLTGTENRYDFKRTNHHHFYCMRCGKILDIDVSCSFQGTMLNGDHRIEEVHGYFKGICNICLLKEKGEPVPQNREDDNEEMIKVVAPADLEKQK